MEVDPDAETEITNTRGGRNGEGFGRGAYGRGAYACGRGGRH